MNLKYILFLILLILSGCENEGNDCCTLIDVEVRIHYQTESGKNLINSSPDFDESKLKVYYKNGDQYAYVINGSLDFPNMHYIADDGHGNLILTVFPSNYYEGNQSTTLIELNETAIDTLVCEFELSENMEICKAAWLNGVKMNDRFIEIVK